MKPTPTSPQPCTAWAWRRSPAFKRKTFEGRNPGAAAAGLDAALLPVYVVYPPNRHLSAKVRAFVDWTAELFQRDPHLQRHEA